MKAHSCRSCGSANLSLVHDFGSQPLAGRYPASSRESLSERRYPLDLTQCLACGLFQVTNLPPIDEIFHDSYCYSSSTIPSLVSHFAGYAEYIRGLLSPRARIFEFGCNDGVLLEKLKQLGFECHGVDASDNVAEMARQKGLEVRTAFLSAGFVEEFYESGTFDLVTCSNVFAHIHDLAGAIAAVRLLLADGGLFCVEVHDAGELAAGTQFDTIYHEHLSYYTEETLAGMLERNAFEVLDVQRTRMHGGGLRMCFRKLATHRAGSGVRPVVRLNDTFGPAISESRDHIRRLVAKYGKLWGYGAAGRSQMFINFTETGGDFRGVFDDSPLRQNRYIAGTEVPILPYAGQRGDCCVILAWNYADAISRKLKGAFEDVVTVLPGFKSWND